MKRIQVVDLVRALAILTVMAHHLGFHYLTAPSQPGFLAYAWFRIMINGGFGVTVFFVVSGFVITRLISSQPRPFGLFNPDYRDFYSRRAGRILPPLALTCLVGILMITVGQTFFQQGISVFKKSGAPITAFEYFFKNPGALFTPAFWLSIATFTFYWYKSFAHLAANSHGLHWDLLWSLSVEEQFYFLYPFLLKKIKNERNLRLFLVCVIFYQPVYNALHSFYFPNQSIPILGDLGPFGALATGCLLYLFSERFKIYLSRNKQVSLGICLFGFLLFLKTYLHQDYRVDVGGHILSLFLIAWGIFFFLLGGLHLDFFNSKYWAPLARPGVLSYGGYLFHPAILFFLCPIWIGTNEYLAFVIFAVVTFCLVQLSYRYFEVPCNLWIRRVFGRGDSKVRR